MSARKKKAKNIIHRITIGLTTEDITLLGNLQSKLQPEAGKSVSWGKLIRLGIQALADREEVNDKSL